VKIDKVVIIAADGIRRREQFGDQLKIKNIVFKIFRNNHIPET